MLWVQTTFMPSNRREPAVCSHATGWSYVSHSPKAIVLRNSCLYCLQEGATSASSPTVPAWYSAQEAALSIKLLILLRLRAGVARKRILVGHLVSG